MKPKVLVLSGYGLNCEEETKYAFELAGGKTDIVHINDLIEKKFSLNDYQILAVPGGFSYGDDTGSGNAFANRMRNHLWESINRFLQKDSLVIGICNGFQVLVNLGLLPALNGKYGVREVALTNNDSTRYIDRWVDLKIENNSPWLQNMTFFSAPIAHGEGKFYATKHVMKKLKKNKQIALTYYKGELCSFQNLTANPTGTLENIAGITNETGRIFGLMPHPERAIFITQLPHWTYLKEKYKRESKKIPEYGPGLQIFKNGVNYFL